jgi:regulator of sigma E protease
MNVTSGLVVALQQAFFIIVGIIGIGFLIGFHELGHFLFCKLFRIRTPSFSIGMGPRVLTKKIGDTEFALSAIPLGGYVEIAGAGEAGQPADAGSFAQRPYWQKLCVMAGGIFFNLLFAYLVLAFLFFAGMPRSFLYPLYATTKITAIEPGSPAEQVQLKPEDTITSLNGNPVSKAADIIQFIQEHPQETVTIGIQRPQEPEVTTISAQLGERELPKGKVGFLGAYFVTPRFSLIDSLKNAFWATYSLTASVIEAFKGLLFKRQFNNLGGPLSVIAQTVKSASHGFKIFLLLLAFVSINLAVLNLIPLPILDGGQVLYYTIEAIIRRPLPDRVREYIHYATWILMILLVLFLSIRDVISFCKP